MKKFKKSTLLIAAILMAVVSPLIAVSMTVTWEWLLDDADVTAYRYQVGGEDEDGWTVIDADTDELTLSDLDPASDYTLYLQRTYDGENWSESASATAEAMIVEIPEGIETKTEFEAYQAEQAAAEAAAAEEAAAEEEAVVEEEEPVAEEEAVEEAEAEEEAAVEEEVIEEEEEPVVEEEVAEEPVIEEEEPVIEEEEPEEVPSEIPETVIEEEEEPAPAAVAVAESKLTDNYEFSLLVNFGMGHGGMNFDDFLNPDFFPAKFGLGFEFKDIVSNKVAGLTLRLNVGTNFNPYEGWVYDDYETKDYFDITEYDFMFNVDAMVLANFGGSTNLVNFYLGGGAGYAGNLRWRDEKTTDTSRLLDFHTFDVSDGPHIDTDFYAAGLVGIRFEMGKVFSLGLEGNYRYYIGSDKHYASADIVLGFTF